MGNQYMAGTILIYTWPANSDIMEINQHCQERPATSLNKDPYGFWADLKDDSEKIVVFIPWMQASLGVEASSILRLGTNRFAYESQGGLKMKHGTRVFLFAVCVALWLVCLSTVVYAEGSSTELVVLSTTDMHGKCWETNLLTGGKVTQNM